MPTKDQYRGMLYGVALGDAWGTPYEFRYGSTPYKSHIDRPTISDDTEMMLALCNGLIEGNKNFEREIVLYEYIVWANSEPEDMGRNTRFLFYHPTMQNKMDAIRKYNAAYKEVTSCDSRQWSQSNGGLMRCAPLAFLPSSGQFGYKDMLLSNPHPVCMNCSFIYCRLLYSVLEGKNETSIEDWAKFPEIRLAIREGLSVSRVDQPGPRNVSQNRGWICHGLYFAIIAYHYPFESFTQAMDFIIGQHLDSDTDTNAAIAGAILGAKYGYDWIRADRVSGLNLDNLMKTSEWSRRPPKYRVSMIEEVLTLLSANRHTAE